MLTAKRFTPLTDDAFLGVTNFLTAGNTGPLSAALQNLPEVLGKLKTFFGNNSQDAIDDLLNTKGAPARMARDFFSSNSGQTTTPGAEFETQLRAALVGAEHLIGYFQQLGPSCLSNAIRGPGGLRNGSNLLKLGDLKRLFKSQHSCSAQALLALLGTLSGGNYSPTVHNHSSLPTILTGVVNRGYQLGLPGVFSAATSSISDPTVLGAMGVAVLQSTTGAKDVLGTLDVLESAPSQVMRLLHPDLIPAVLNGYSVPTELTGASVGALANRLVSSLTAVDPGWKVPRITSAAITTRQGAAANPDTAKALRLTALNGVTTIAADPTQAPALTLNQSHAANFQARSGPALGTFFPNLGLTV